MKRLGWSEMHSVTRVLILVALLDFLVYAVFTVALGGNAGDGYTSAGHYFVSNHGVLREVGQVAWVLSRGQGYSLYVLLPVAVVAFALDSFRRREEPERKSFLGRGGAPPRRRH